MTTREIVLEMLNEVPKPDGYKMPAGASDAETAAFEGRTGLRTPSRVREWLKTVNGALIGPGGTYGIHPRETWLDIESFLNNFPEWVQHGWIPMAGDGTGNHYVVATETSREPTGAVFFIDTMALGDEPTYIVASDIWHFLRGLFSAEMGEDWWPFEEGPILEADPELVRYTDFNQPWNM